MRWFLGFIMCVWPVLVQAETGLFGHARGALFAVPAASGDVRDGASLFAGQSGGSFFAPFAGQRGPSWPRHALAAVQRLRDVIGQAESPRDGYDAVQHGARIKPPRPPTQMTLAEIYAWIDATPGQPHAIGRYQFIPETLHRVAEQVGARPSERFRPALQDRLADVLLVDAGLPDFLEGALARKTFMNNLAAIWAGLPTSNGMSRYHGIAGNRATISLAHFRAEIAKIDPG